MSELSLKLNDGLDLRLSVAGPGARAYAFLIDFKFRVLAALLWLGIGMTIFHFLGREEFGDIFEEAQKPYLVTVVIPTLVIYFLYHPIFELLLGGRTPGKILAGIRIVDQSGRTPSAMQIVLRNVFRLIDSLPALYALGLLLSFFGHARARVGDLAAGTVLVHDGARSKALRQTLKQISSTVLEPAQWDFARSLIERWRGLMPQERQRLASEFLAQVMGSNRIAADPASQLAALKRLVG
jgi:uncharacterized RDD family membrane protein YckC